MIAMIAFEQTRGRSEYEHLVPFHSIPFWHRRECWYFYKSSPILAFIRFVFVSISSHIWWWRPHPGPMPFAFLPHLFALQQHPLSLYMFGDEHTLPLMISHYDHWPPLSLSLCLCLSLLFLISICFDFESIGTLSFCRTTGLSECHCLWCFELWRHALPWLHATYGSECSLNGGNVSGRGPRSECVDLFAECLSSTIFDAAYILNIESCDVRRLTDWLQVTVTELAWLEGPCPCK